MTASGPNRYGCASFRSTTPDGSTSYRCVRSVCVARMAGACVMYYLSILLSIILYIIVCLSVHLLSIYHTGRRAYRRRKAAAAQAGRGGGRGGGGRVWKPAAPTTCGAARGGRKRVRKPGTHFTFCPGTKVQILTPEEPRDWKVDCLVLTLLALLVQMYKY